MDIITIFLYLLGVAVVSISLFCVCLLVSADTYPNIVEFNCENEFIDPPTGEQHKFPKLTDPATCSLSVIVPAYNEEERLPPMLDECIGYLESQCQNKEFTYEIIVVDDGSKDGTTQIGHDYGKKFGSDKVRVLTLAKNRGKGAAVRLGMFRARGKLLLFADADGATTFSEYAKVETSIHKLCTDVKCIDEALAVCCGSRAHLEEESVASRSYFRTVLMYGFHFLVWFFTVRDVRDTQCGFKLFTRRSARILFNSLHIERWAFDVELLYIAQSLGIPISEVAVKWTEIDGSKVTPVWSWIQMGRDLLLIWLHYTLGAWRIRGDMKAL